MVAYDPKKKRPDRTGDDNTEAPIEAILRSTSEHTAIEVNPDLVASDDWDLVPFDGQPLTADEAVEATGSTEPEADTPNEITADAAVAGSTRPTGTGAAIPTSDVPDHRDVRLAIAIGGGAVAAAVGIVVLAMRRRRG